MQSRRKPATFHQGVMRSANEDEIGVTLFACGGSKDGLILAKALGGTAIRFDAKP